jgi:hypothetical protein
MESLRYRRAPAHVCHIGGICYDTSGVGRYVEISTRLSRPAAPVAVALPER